MSDYTITTDFGAKDLLNAGDSGKVIKGSEFTAEFTAIKTAVNSKADTASPTFTGTITVPGLTTTADVSFGDNDKANFGASNDLQIYHDGTNSYLEEAGTGSMFFRTNGNGFFFSDSTYNFISTLTANGAARLHYGNDGTVKLATNNTGVDVTGTADMDTLSIGGTAVTATATELNYVDGVTSNVQTQLDSKVAPDGSGNITLDDNKKIILGSGSDLAVYHDGSNSYLEDVGTGNLIVRTNGTSLLIQNNGDEDFIVCNATTNAVGIYHNNDVRLSTTSTGVDITGLVVCDELRIDTPSVPSTASSSGTKGEIAYDSDYIYVCTATDTWKRVAIATW